MFTPDKQREHFALLRRPNSGKREGQRIFDLQAGEFAKVGVHVVEIDNFGDLDTVLQQLVARCRPMRVYVSGSPIGEKKPIAKGAYPTTSMTKEMQELADLLGEQLADKAVRVMAGGMLGAQVGYALERRLLATNTYSPERFVLV